MRVVEKIRDMQRKADLWRREGKKIALVPTMGFFHEGHLALLRRARELGDVAGFSLFVNPTQFGPGEDYEQYPRDVERDMRQASETGMDFAFVPKTEDMYPPGFQTYVEVKELTRPLCGVSRPVHFRGVATVVCKLFHAVKPHTAVFGEKDYQQLVAVRRMVKDLSLDVEVESVPIVREKDGLAMSSRNAYLSAEERKVALRLNRSLREARARVEAGERDPAKLLADVRKILEEGGGLTVDYAEIRHPESLETVERLSGPALLALAAYVGKTRLIDNCILNPPA